MIKVSGIPAGSSKDVTVAFGRTMPKTPSFVAMRGGAGVIGYNIAIATIGINQTEAYVRIWNYGNTDVDIWMQWMAIGI